MQIEIKIPPVGESVQEALLTQWYKQDGDSVHKDEPLFNIETDKVTLDVNAEAAGTLKILAEENQTLAVGSVVGTIDTGSASDRPNKSSRPESTATEPAAVSASKPDTLPTPEKTAADSMPETPTLSPSVRRLVAEHRLDPNRIVGTGPGGKITKGDVLLYLEQSPPPAPSEESPRPSEAESAPAEPVPLPESLPLTEEKTTRRPMSPIRRRIASRLLEAKQNTAMLTTFNEIDMSWTMALRNRFKDAFKKKYGVSLGYMSFFIRACAEALKEFPEINAFIQETDIVEHHYCHIGIAVGSERGLVVPVIRHADRLSFAETELQIAAFVEKIQENRLELSDLEGGTFTLTNGGIYGSLLSTPILNTPQSGILGMHTIEKRAVVVNDEIVIRPMMYVALSYDHRIVDGRSAVSFLKRIKECIETPARMMLEI